MKTLVAACLLVLLALPTCVTPSPTPQPQNPSAAVDCLKGVEQSAISLAIGKINTVIATGVTSGTAESVVLKNLESLAVTLAPDAFACAMQYVSSKLHFDSLHGTTPESRSTHEQESQIAKKYIELHGFTYTGR